MPRSSVPSFKRILITGIKIGYYEISTIIFLSTLFWLCVLPIFTIGSAILALFDTIEEIYQDSAPTGEYNRVQYYLRSVKYNAIRGIPLSLIIIFIISNTIWYFSIAISGQELQYILGGIIGIYLCILIVFFVIRGANIMTQENLSWRKGLRSAIESWGEFPNTTILQITIAVPIIVLSIFLPVALVFLLPSGLVLFDTILYKELHNKNPQAILTRYKVQ